MLGFTNWSDTVTKRSYSHRIIAALGILSLASTAIGQWNPQAGQWGKTEQTDLRVMTWNVQDGLCSSQAKLDGTNNWGAAARIVALVRPDVLILQETGDNSGNGTGSGVDSVGALQTIASLFLRGGTDPFLGGSVTGYVQQYAPGYDLPYVFVSNNTDGFNRNIILSRFSFEDLNGDGQSQLSDIPGISMRANSYAVGGNGGIRGFAFAEIDLPDEIYAGDLVVGNAHLKSGSAQGDINQRFTAATNVAYYIDYLFNGGGTVFPDPSNAILDNPPATRILPLGTAVVYGGDWNEDELTNGRRGPAAWLTEAEFAGTLDGVDRDRTDAIFDNATDPWTGSRATLSGSKLDYLAWFDSVSPQRRSFIVNTSTMNAPYPAEFTGIARPRDLSGAASDHRPVIVDLVLPLTPPCLCTADTNSDCISDAADLSVILSAFGASVPIGTAGDLNGDAVVDAADLSVLLSQFGCH